MKKFALSIVAAVALGSTAFAGGDVAPVEPVMEDSGFYVGLGYSYMSLEETITSEKLTGNALMLIAGYQFNSYLAVEGRYSTTVGDVTASGMVGIPDRDIDAELTNIGIYLKPMYTTGQFSLYALVGYGKLTLTDPGGGDHSESGLQWGFGAGYKVNANLSINVDYMRYYDDTGFDDAIGGSFESDAVSLSVTYRF